MLCFVVQTEDLILAIASFPFFLIAIQMQDYEALILDTHRIIRLDGEIKKAPCRQCMRGRHSSCPISLLNIPKAWSPMCRNCGQLPPTSVPAAVKAHWKHFACDNRWQSQVHRKHTVCGTRRNITRSCAPISLFLLIPFSLSN